MLLSKEFRFEASHQLPRHKGKCARLHGHSWMLTVRVEGPVQDASGMVLDYFEIKESIQPVIDRLDHTHLGSGYIYEAGQIIALGSRGYKFNQWLYPSHEPSLPENPTSENLCLWIADQLPLTFPWHSLTLNETCTTSCTLTRTEWLARKENHGVHQETEDSEGRQTPQGTAQGRAEERDVRPLIPEESLREYARIFNSEEIPNAPPERQIESHDRKEHAGDD